MTKTVKTWLKKWGTRILGISSIGGIVILLLAGLISYKARMVLIGVSMSEALWLIWFKPAFGKIEDLSGYSLLGVALLRGLLILACVLGMTMGL